MPAAKHTHQAFRAFGRHDNAESRWADDEKGWVCASQNHLMRP